MVSLEYSISGSDFLEFQISYINNSSKAQSEIKKSRLFILLLYICIVVVYMLLDLKKIIRYAGIGIISIISISQFLKARNIYIRNVIMVAKRMISNDSANKTLGKKKLVLDNNTITVTGNGSVSVYDIKSLYTLRESFNCFFLYRDEISAIIVSKNAFKSKNDEFDFIKEIKKQMEKK